MFPLFCGMLVVLAVSAPTVTTDSTSVSGYCSGVPYWKLNLCNITCSTCQASSYNQCSSCDSNFTLSGTKCTLSNDSYTYIYLTYFLDFSITNTELNLWTEDSSNKKLGTSNTVKICSNTTTESYQFQMVGLFNINQKLSYTVTFTETISYITVKFNLLLLNNDATLTVYLGEETVYSTTYNSLANINATYYSSTNATEASYLVIPSLTSSNARTIIQEVSVNLALSKTSISLSMSVNSATPVDFWGISDFAILFQECNTCPKTDTLSLISSLGLGIGYTAAFLVPVLIIFVIMLKGKDYLQQ